MQEYLVELDNLETEPEYVRVLAASRDEAITIALAERPVCFVDAWPIAA